MKTLISITGAIALMGFAIVGAQASAQTPLKTKTAVGAPAQSMAPAAARKINSPFGSVMSPGTLKLGLNETECVALGGSVKIDVARLCIGGKLCETKDQTGDTHQVCINSK